MVSNKYYRTIGDYNIVSGYVDDECLYDDSYHTKDIIIRKEGTINKKGIIDNTHESIIKLLCDKMNPIDTLTLKVTTQHMNRCIASRDIIDSMIADSGIYKTISKLVAGNALKFLEYVLEKNVPENYVISNKYKLLSLFFAINAHYNDVAKLLIKHITFKKQISGENKNYFFPYFYELKWYAILEHNYDIYNKYETSVSMRCLVNYAISCDNLEMYKYLIDEYKIHINDIETWSMLMFESSTILDYMFKITPNFKIGQKMLVRYVYDQEHFIGKIHFLGYLLSKRYIGMSTKLLNAILIQIKLFNVPSNSLLSIMKIIDSNTTKRQIQHVLRYCIKHYMIKSLFIIASHYKRAVYKPKLMEILYKLYTSKLNHIKILLCEESFIKDLETVESILYNKIRLEERKNMHK